MPQRCCWWWQYRLYRLANAKICTNCTLLLLWHYNNSAEICFVLLCLCMPMQFLLQYKQYFWVPRHPVSDCADLCALFAAHAAHAVIYVTTLQHVNDSGVCKFAAVISLISRQLDTVLIARSNNRFDAWSASFRSKTDCDCMSLACSMRDRQ